MLQILNFLDLVSLWMSQEHFSQDPFRVLAVNLQMDKKLN